MTEKIEVIARVVHEAIRAYQVAVGQSPAAPWDEARPASLVSPRRR